MPGGKSHIDWIDFLIYQSFTPAMQFIKLGIDLAQ